MLSFSRAVLFLYGGSFVSNNHYFGAFAQTLCTGPSINFDRADSLPNGDSLLPANIDCIRPSTCIARCSTGGSVFNSVVDGVCPFTDCTGPMPTNTEWAFGSISDGIGTLSFGPFLSGSFANCAPPTNIVGAPAVVHLIAEDEYYDIQFSRWQQGGGGGFAYMRSTCSGGGGFGDPHLKTWDGKVYDYHGECDLVLASSKIFGKGLGLDIHIRTKIRDYWSYISAAAVRIGEDILEVQSFGKYYFNQVENATLPQEIGGFRAKHMPPGRRNRPERFLIYVGLGRIDVRVYKDFVAVYIERPSEEDFGDAIGLMGNFHTSAWLLRDGLTIAKDPNTFGAEWQVRDDEHHLFMAEGSVMYPTTCRLPSVTENARRHRRLEESSISMEMAEEACKNWVVDKEFCIEDVILTGDVDVAIAGAGAY